MRNGIVQVRRTAGSSDKTNGITAMFALALRTIICELTQASTGGLRGGLWEVLREVLGEVLKNTTR